MKDFEWCRQTKVIFGNGAADRIGEVAVPYGRKALLVYGTSSIKKTGLYERVLSQLQNADISVVDFGGVKANPVLSQIRKGIKLTKDEGIEFLIAVGGGSVIDTAKGIAIGALTDQDIWDFFTYKAFPEKALPIVTLVTVAGSGSEMSSHAVITNEETKQKFGLTSDTVCPVVSILDPAITFTVSKTYTAYASADIFSHVLDAYFTSTAEWAPLPDGIMEAILKALMQSVDRIVNNPDDYDARATMMWCAPWAMNGFIHCGLGFTSYPLHILEHPVSGLFDIAHGAGMSIIIPAWLKITSEKLPSRCAQLARNVFDVIENDDVKASEEGIAVLKNWFDFIGAPTSFSAAGISAKEVDRLIEVAYNDNQMKSLGMEVPREDIAGVYNLAR